MNETKVHPRIGGIKKPSFFKRIDPRRFSYKKKFGSVELLPTEDFDVYTPKEVKNQLNTDMCQSFAVAYSGEPHTGYVVDECYQYAATKAEEGNVNAGPADPYDAEHGAMHKGLRKKADSPFKVGIDDPLKIADIKNYPDEPMVKEISFYDVKSMGKDYFDAIRATMWRGNQMGFPTMVRVGAEWKKSWMSSLKGRIVSDPDEPFSYHEFTAVGQRENGTMIRFILSSGSGVGDGGYFYMPREIVNKFFFAVAFGQGNPQDYKDNLWSILAKLVNVIMNWLLKMPSIPPDAVLPPPAGNVFKILQ